MRINVYIKPGKLLVKLISLGLLTICCNVMSRRRTRNTNCKTDDKHSNMVGDQAFSQIHLPFPENKNQVRLLCKNIYEISNKHN